MEFYDFPIMLGMSSSQLTIRPSFFRGVGWNHQAVYNGILWWLIGIESIEPIKMVALMGN